MTSNRLPRFEHSPNATNIVLTDRDIQILQALEHHRFLRSTHISSLVPGSPQGIIRRLQLLFHHGYIERPRAQIDYYRRGGSTRMVYGLGQKGARLVREAAGVPTRGIDWSEKNRSVGRIFLDHALLISDIMVRIELECRANSRFRFLDLKQARSEDHADTESCQSGWKVKLGNSVTLGVIPDRIFGMEWTSDSRGVERCLFFLEADRGTMPVTRRDLKQTSFQRKLLLYQATWEQSIHRTCFGFNRFRVVTVTSGAKRLHSILDASQELTRGHGLFLFVDSTVLTELPSILGPIWRTPKSDIPRGLFD